MAASDACVDDGVTGGPPGGVWATTATDPGDVDGSAAPPTAGGADDTRSGVAVGVGDTVTFGAGLAVGRATAFGTGCTETHRPSHAILTPA